MLSVDQGNRIADRRGEGGEEESQSVQNVDVNPLKKNGESALVK